MVQQELNRLVKLRDSLNLLDPQWLIYNNQIQMLIAMQGDKQVCVLKASEVNIPYIKGLQTWASVKYLLPLFQLAMHSAVEYNYDYLQLIIREHRRWGVKEKHPKTIPVLDDLKGEYTFKNIDIIDHHLIIELQEKDRNYA